MVSMKTVYLIAVEVPMHVGMEVIDRIYDAVAEAAHDAKPKDRDGWDIFVYGMPTEVADNEEIAEFGREIGLLDG